MALKARLAAAITDHDTPSRELAPLTRRLLEVSRDLAALDARQTQEKESRPLADERWSGV